MESDNTSFNHTESLSPVKNNKRKSTSTLKTQQKKKKSHKVKGYDIDKFKRRRGLMNAIANAQSQEDQAQLMENMRGDDFKYMCNCVNDFTHQRGPMDGYLDESEIEYLSGCIEPWSKDLKRFSSSKTPLKLKQKLIRKRQKGGSAILAAVIGSLLPLAVNAVERWAFPAKNNTT